jgi:Ca-activated chloride channel homolog
MLPNSKHASGLCFSVILLILLASIFHAIEARSQDEPEDANRRRPTKPALPSRDSQENQNNQKGFKIGVNVDLVVMHTSVFDKNGQFVSGLKKENFKVYEDGIEQKMLSFSQEDVPVSMGILLDLSGSMRNKSEQTNKAALAFIRASNPQDQVFLVGFNDEVELLQDYTSDIDEITDSLDNTIISGGTALYDAIYVGVEKAQKGVMPKKAVVVITDGEDKDSYYKLDELVTKVQELDVQVFCIGFLTPGPDKGLFGHFTKSASDKAKEALQRISDETGGKAFFPQSLADMGAIVSEIANELRNQYSLGYVSSNTRRDGSFRRVKIDLDAAKAANFHVRYRRGYFAPKSAMQSQVN